ncbi:MAG: DNRLRE domain-containing protein [Clostridia bacterium]|nr:DNRLRE domain-containing protein [Clostridia bacterium]
MKNFTQKAICLLLVLLLTLQSMPLRASALEAIRNSLSDFSTATDLIQSDVNDVASPIIGEDISLRDANTKHFRHEDGSYTAAMYDSPVHYYADGEWKDIDNTLTLTTATAEQAARYETVASGTPVSFPQAMTENEAITVFARGYDLAFSLQTQTGLSASASVLQTATASEEPQSVLQAQTNDSTVRYENVLGNTDLQYDVTSSAVKESIVIKAKQNEYVYRFNMNLDGLQAVTHGDGSIALIENDDIDNPVFVIAVPYMFDAAGAYSDAVSMQIEQNGDSAVLTVTADREWIDSDNRVFPVTVDPTLLVDVGASNIYDAYVDSSEPYSSHPYDNYLYVGRNSLGTTRTFIWFNLPDLPDCSVVTDAYLHLAQNQYDPGNGAAAWLSVGVPGGVWSEAGVTWYNQPPVNEEIGWVDFAPFVSGTGEYNYELNITKIVKKWYEEANSNYGLLLKAYNEATVKRSRFYSAEFNYTSGYPVFQVTYVNSTGLEDYWSYETVDLGTSGTIYVNDYNGALTYVHSDIALGGNILPLALSHVFNSTEVSEQPVLAGNVKLGSGFRLSLSESLAAITSSSVLYEAGYRAKLTDSDGTVHYFKETDTANTFAYEFDDTVLLRYVGNQGDHYYTITYEDGSQCLYSYYGYLVAIIDTNGNRMNLNYESRTPYRLMSVTDGAGRVLTLTYANNYLTSVSVPSGPNTTRSITYAYTNGKLTQITYPDNTYTKLYYDTNGMLTRVLAADTTDVLITYKEVASANKSFYRVESLTRRGTGTSETADRAVYNTLTFTYRGSDTVVEDANENITYIGFDNAGRAITARNQDGDIAVSAYNSSGNLNNTLAYSSGSFRFADNLLQNSSFENDYTGWTKYISGSTGYTFHTLSEGAFSGSKAIALTRTVAGSAIVNQNFDNVTPGSEYTFSAYFKIVEELTSGNFDLSIEVYNGDTHLFTERSMNYTLTDGWERAQVSVELPAEATRFRVYASLRSGAVGTVLVDACQLEQSGAAGQFNMLQNPGMTRTTTAGAVAEWLGVGNTALVTNNELMTGNAVSLTGYPASDVYVYQDIPVSGTAGTTLVFGATALANAASGNPLDANKDPIRSFCAEITLYNGTQVVGTAKADYNRNAMGTVQAIASSLTAEQDFTSVRFKLLYGKQINTALFDDAYLYIDAFGTSYSYDEHGKLILAENDNGDAIGYTYNGPDLTEISYQKDGTEYDGIDYKYDPTTHNLLTATTKNTGIVTTYTYPETGNRGLPTAVSVKNADGTLQSSMVYDYTDDFNYLESETDALGNTVQYQYNTYLGYTTAVIDPEGNKTSYDYNLTTGMLTAVNADLGENATVSNAYTYTAQKQLQSVSHNGFSYGFEYDVFGRTEKTTVAGTTLGEYDYNPDGTLQSMTYGNEVVHSYSYDSLDRLTSESYNGIETYAYRYNAAGQLGRHEDYENNVTWLYGYDLVGRLTDVQATDGTRLSYAYDEHNNIQSYTAQKNGTTLSAASYTYTDEGLPVTATVGGENGTQFSYEYDSLNRLQSLSFEAENNNIIETEYYYAPGTDGQTTGVVDQVNYYIRFYEGSGYYSTYPLQASYGYTYDKNGNITLIENNWGDRSYEYDKLNRLVRENDELLDQTVVYAYDNGGNILTKTYYDYTTDEIGTLKDTVTYTYDSVWKDKLLTYDGGTTITYDEIGNPLTYNGYTFTWQKGRQLASASGNGYTITYKYSADGLRTEKTVNGVTTEYTYVSGLLAAQTDGTNTLQFYYAPDDTCLAVTYNGTMYYYIYNLQGDVVKITNANGSTIVEYKYDTWGKLIATTGSLASTLGALNPFRYRGYVYDTETGFYYLTTRYYDPDTGRFINADGYISTGYAIIGFNMYAYCLNDPVNLIDSNGDDPTPGWAQRINNGTATYEDYLEALNADPSAWAGLARSNVDRAIKTAKNYNPGTTTIGVNVNGTWGMGGTVSFGIAYDNWGNVGLLLTIGILGGTPSVGVDGFATVTTAPDISRLEGAAVVAGGSVSLPTMPSFGAEATVFYDKYTSEMYIGGTGSVGKSFEISPLLAGGYVGVTNSKILYSFNINELKNKLSEIIWDGD